MSEAKPKLEVAICGAGVSGLTLAAIISQHSSEIVVNIYERGDEISTGGDGISIWKRSWQVLQELGLEKALEEKGSKAPPEAAIVFRKSDQPDDAYDFYSHVMPYNPISISRPILLEILQSKLGENCAVHTSKHATGFTQSPGSGVTISFEDGTSAQADFVVGADGIYSKMRGSLYRLSAEQTPQDEKAEYLRSIEPTWSGTLAYRGHVSAELLKQKHPGHQALYSAKIWCGKGKHAVSYWLPESGDRPESVHFICYVTEDATFSKTKKEESSYGYAQNVSAETVRSHFKGWEKDLCDLLELMGEGTREWAIHVVNPLALSISERSTLLGDAWHAMTPHQGVGGGQAIEDAHLLGMLLAHEHTTIENIPKVLRIYRDLRLPRVKLASEKSRLNGLMYEFDGIEQSNFNSSCREDVENLGKAIGKGFEWVAEGSCTEVWEKARNQLNQLNST